MILNMYWKMGIIFGGFNIINFMNIYKNLGQEKIKINYWNIDIIFLPKKYVNIIINNRNILIKYKIYILLNLFYYFFINIVKSKNNF